MAITVYGASDDLIEIEGDIREEFHPGDESAPTYLAFSTGAALSIRYTDEGIWRVTPVSSHGLSIEQAPADDDANYTDRAHIEGDIKWVVGGQQFARP
jgi:hypothetical protein